jgi:hypothetical protein
MAPAVAYASFFALQASPRQAGTAGCVWRTEYEGSLYHVLSRDNQKQNFVITCYFEPTEQFAQKHVVVWSWGDEYSPVI